MPRVRLAVLGGRARPDITMGDTVVRYFGSAGDEGPREARRLESALRAGSIDRVIIVTRWNGHTTAARIRRVCRVLDIPVDISRNFPCGVDPGDPRHEANLFEKRALVARNGTQPR